jgi:hypothetical protein
LYALTNAVYQYAVENNGNLPSVVTTTPTDVGTGTGLVNLEPILVPTYIAAIPFDPSNGTAADTNYTIFTTSEGRLVASATGELVGSITVNR